MIDIFIFIAMPYTALLVMLIGSIYLYRTQSFKVSALSTQLLENKQLYYGANLMHWGIIVLFFGHLIGFLFPKSVIAWNGQTTRLLILEVTAFTCGMLFFAGVSLLIYRRIVNRKLQALTTDMDMVVYTTLLTQAITGIMIAVMYRWGSGWFAVTFSPYLKSLFVLQPDIAAVSAMPLVVKIHVACAYVIVALIPFSRFMHFLVFPVKYISRAYQVVIWNRDRKLIRNSEAITPEVKAKNN